MPRGTQEHNQEASPFRLRDYHPYGSPFQKLSTKVRFVTSRLLSSEDRYALQPPSNIGIETTELLGFGLFPVRSPLLGESRLIYFPRGT